MNKKLMSIGIAVLLIVGALFVYAATNTDQVTNIVKQPTITTKSTQSCGCGCDGNCGGTCGVDGCKCGK